jgi:thioredoxin 1
MSIHIRSKNELLSCLNQHSRCIIKFTAAWCGPCRVIKPFVEELAKANPDICFLSVDVEECDEIAESFQVQAMPTFVGVVNKTEISRFSGAMKAKVEELVATLKA